MAPFNSIEVPCSHCGKPLLRPKWRIERNANHFCGHACKAAFQAKRPNPKRRRRIGLTCAHCGRTYTKTSSTTTSFCSIQCCGAARQGKANPHYASVDVSCAHCGKMLQRAPSRIKRQRNHFCDHRCKAEWQKTHQRGENNPAYRNGGHTVSCAHCGKEFTVTGWKVENRKNLFCSQECYWAWKPENHSGPNSPSWKGGPVDYYGPNWKSQRRKARKRDGYKCQHCGKSEKELGRELDVHHIKPFRSFAGNHRAANHLSNLISLCGSCHMRAEHGKIAVQPKLI